jgi:hypothetical protein
MATMTLQELTAKLPPALQPLAALYAPMVLTWSVDQIQQWLVLVASGDIATAYAAVLKGMPTQVAVDQGAAVVEASWAAANAASTKTVATVRTAMAAIVSVVLALALAMVGL